MRFFVDRLHAAWGLKMIMGVNNENRKGNDSRKKVVKK
jgi:hypothetical protein